jgi:phosphohistidine phosphatase SixA
MSKFAVLPHGWFLRLGKKLLYQSAAKVTLTKKLIPKMIDEETFELAVYAAPEAEAKATANAIAQDLNASVQIDASLSDDGDVPSLVPLIGKLIAARDPAIVITHRRRLKAILKAVRTVKENRPLKIVGHRPFFGNQALLVDPDSLTVDVVSIK